MEKARGVFCVVPQRCVHDTRLQRRPKTLLCLLALCNYANRTGVCYPNQKTISQDLNITQSTVSRHIKLLKEYGYVRMASKKNKSGSISKALSWRSNAYFIVFDESVTEEDAIAAQTSRDWDQIEEQNKQIKASLTVDKPLEKKSHMQSEHISNMHSEYISNTSTNTINKDISKNIINEFKKMLETKFGHVIVWKGEDQQTVQQWLDKGHKPEFILKVIANTLDYRKDKGLDSIKRITYFHKKFMDVGPKNKKESLDQLLGKFVSTHRIR